VREASLVSQIKGRGRVREEGTRWCKHLIFEKKRKNDFKAI